MKVRNNNKGFTLMELIIVIVVLGILSAIAVPKFTNVAKDARVSVVKNFAGSIKESMNIVRMKYITSGNSTNTVEIDGQTVTVDARQKFPVCTCENLQKIIEYDTSQFNCQNTKGGVGFAYYTVPVGGVDGIGDESCGVYIKLDSNGYPTYHIETGGC